VSTSVPKQTGLDHPLYSNVFGRAQQVDKAVNLDRGFDAMAAEMDIDLEDGLCLPHSFLIILI
jgi:hypothetical protein